MTQILVAVALVWLLVLSIGLLGLLRYVGVLQAAGGGATQGRGSALLETDGPWIPSPLPDRAVAAFRAHDVSTDDLVATFFSPTCGTCLERAEQIATGLVDPARNVFLVTGHDPETGADLRQILAGTGVRIIPSPDAQNILKSLDISSTPFTFRVVDGQVVAKSYVRAVNDYLRMFETPAPSEPEDTKLPVPTK